MSEVHISADWIGVDWGTSNLRAWAMTAAGQALASVESAAGMGAVEQGGFEQALLDLISPWLGPEAMPVLICGMAGARQGWHEAPYLKVPAAPVGTPVRVSGTDPRIDVRILPGMSQEHPPDVMRGEETQIAGVLAENADFDGVICLPGTHTKWVHVSAGEVVSFQTFMTGELFQLLSQQSVLRHSLVAVSDACGMSEFDTALGDALSKSDALASQLFRIRARDLLEGAGAAVSTANLSGALIGAELAAARPYWLGREVAIVGAKGLAALYATALKTQAVPVTTLDADRMVQRGLATAIAVHGA